MFVNRQHVRLYYETAGSGDPPLVFVHGWCCDHTFFQPQVDYFTQSHRAVTLDLRGHGKSDMPDDRLDMATFADDVARLCADVGLSRPVIVGHSLGGAVAVELAARHPALPGAVIALEPAPIDASAELVAVLFDLAQQLQGPDADAARRAFIERFCFIPTDSTERRRRIVEQMCSVPLSVAAASVRAVAEWDGGTALGACAMPTLVLLRDVAGTNDPARLRARKPDVHIGVTVGAGHFHQLEVPEQVTPMIDRFLRITTQAVVPAG